jgi:O-antigen ligase
MFADHPLGVGVGRFREEARNYDTGQFRHAFSLPRRVTHNTYLLCATELGVAGLTVLTLLIALSLRKLQQCARLAPDTLRPTETRLISFGCALSVIVYLAAAAFTDRLYTESFWWVLALPVMLRAAIVREVESIVELTPVLAKEDADDDFVASDVWPGRLAPAPLG